MIARISSEKKRLEIITYGTEGDPDLLIDRIFLGARESKARLVFRGRVWGELELAIPGRHNLRNAAAAAAMGSELGA
ncbi:Mur ligase family protein, partial [Vibrio parahaemolyticus]|uniref:Mur ligase family protein n=1 Tax=Vibrio parahaemolyticus TaxID=670 RepID=UPI0021138498|nr:Mur ligase family protein [Vibrio parahaemolyticus]